MLFLVATGCTSDEPVATTGTPPPTTSATSPAATTTVAPTTTTATPLPPVVLPASAKTPFGTLTEVAFLTGGPAYGGPDHPSGLGSVEIADWIGDYLRANDAEATLTNNGFVVIPGTIRHFHHL